MALHLRQTQQQEKQTTQGFTDSLYKFEIQTMEKKKNIYIYIYILYHAIISEVYCSNTVSQFKNRYKICTKLMKVKTYTEPEN